MVMTSTPDSCTGRIFSDTGYLFTTYSTIASIAQKIADFATGIFTAIANFVKYCLCISRSLPLPTPSAPTRLLTTPTPTTTAHSTTTLPAHSTTFFAPTTTISPPVVDGAFIESGKQILLERVASLDQANLGNEFRAQLDTEGNGQLAFATLSMEGAITLPSDEQIRFLTFITQCALPTDCPFPDVNTERAIEVLPELATNYSRLDENGKQDVLTRFKAVPRRLEGTPEEAVAKVLRPINTLRVRLIQNPTFCAAADAARAELLARGPRVRN